MARDFIAVDRGQLLLMPPSLNEWLPEDHLVWTVLGAVEVMDLSRFNGAYRLGAAGRPAYDPQMMGWIQLVVATPDVEELPWAERIALWIVPLQQGGAVLDVRLRDGGNIGSGSGRRSLEVHQAKTLRWRRESCRALVSGGSARVAGCRLSPSRRCLGAICPSPSERRSQCCSPVVVGCERSPVSSVGRRRRSPGNCNATQRSAAAGLSTGPRLPRRMRTDAPVDPSRPSSRSTRSCGPMCKPGFPGLCSGPTGALRVRRSAGAGDVMDRARTGAGDSAGVRSRSPVASALTSPMMSRCACLMRRSISRSMCRAAERCAVSCPLACGRVGRCGSPG